MQPREYPIILDVRGKNDYEYIEIVQNDRGTNIFNISINDGEEKYPLNDTIIDIVFRKKDNTVVTQGTEDEELPITVVDGIIKCIVKTNSIAAPGTVQAEVEIRDLNGNLLTSQEFDFTDRKRLMTDAAVESTNEFPLLQRLINKVEELYTEFDIKVTELNNLTSTVTQNEQERQQNETRREQLKAEIEQLKDELLQLQIDLQDALDNAIDTNESITQAEDLRVIAEQQREILKGELLQLQTNLNDKLVEVNTALSDMNSLSSTVSQNESERDNAEGARQQAEESREIAEDARVLAEQCRVSAEENRVTEFAGFEDRIEDTEDEIVALKEDLTTQKAEFTQHKLNYTTLEGVNDGVVTPNKTSFLTKIEDNLFDGAYVVNMGLLGSGTTVAYLGTLANSRVAIVPILPNTQYTVTKHSLSNRFRIALFDSYPTYGVDTNVSKSIILNDTLTTFTFMSTGTSNFVAVSVSNDSTEPLLKIENGGVSTPFDMYNLDSGINYDITTDKIKDSSITPNKTNFIAINEDNLFDGVYITNKTFAGNQTTVTSMNDSTTGRVAIVPILPNRIYTITKHSLSDRFRIALFDSYPDLSLASVPVNLSILVDDTLTTKTFTSTETSMYVGIHVDSGSLEPLLKVEESSVSTSYITYKLADNISAKPLLHDGTIKESMIDPSALNNIKNEVMATTGNVWYGKKIVTIGDSITYGFDPRIATFGRQIIENFSKLTSDALGMEFVNYGINSSKIAVNETDATGNPIVLRYSSMDADADLIVIAGGTNDYASTWTPFGDMSSRTNYTFYGALHNLCLGLLDRYKRKNIVFLTPLKRLQGEVNFELPNGNGKTMKDYCNAIKEVCDYYSIPVLDMYSESGINPHIDSQKTEYINDGTHPNPEGHKLIARRLIGYLRQLA